MADDLTAEALEAIVCRGEARIANLAKEMSALEIKLGQSQQVSNDSMQIEIGAIADALIKLEQRVKGGDSPGVTLAELRRQICDLADANRLMAVRIRDLRADVNALDAQTQKLNKEIHNAANV